MFNFRDSLKVYLVHAPWREKMDELVAIIETLRERFHDAVGFNRMSFQYQRGSAEEFELFLEKRFRRDYEFSAWIDKQRQQAIEIMNSLLYEIGHQPLRSIHNG